MSRETDAVMVYVEGELNDKWDEAWKYCQAFGLDTSKLPEPDRDVQETMAQRRYVERERMHPTKVAARELNRQRRLFMNIV
jgi:hypothetical protein